MTAITLENVSLEADGARILCDVSLDLRIGELTALVGPNGAGKSSLMKCALGAIAPTSGAARIDNENAAAMDAGKRARRISYLPQIRPAAWPVIVEDIVALGRFAYGAATPAVKDSNDKAIAEAISACGLDRLRNRGSDTLSGGELARAHCARAFAAQTPFLLADEPTNSLDPAGQVDIMKLIQSYVAGGAGTLVILHDINLAAAFADRLVWMRDGAIIADGAPSETLSEENFSTVFGIDADISATFRNGRVDYFSIAARQGP